MTEVSRVYGEEDVVWREIERWKKEMGPNDYFNPFQR